MSHNTIAMKPGESISFLMCGQTIRLRPGDNLIIVSAYTGQRTGAPTTN